MSIVHSDLYVDKFGSLHLWMICHMATSQLKTWRFFGSQTINHIQQDLAKCGVKCKSRKIKDSYFGYLLELVVEIL
jgi:hypothetical protein